MRIPFPPSLKLFSLCGLIVASWCAAAAPAQAQALSIFHNFDTSASTPASSLVRDSGGNFYGITRSGGSAGHGTIYKIAPDGTTTILHSFGAAAVTLGGSSYADGTVPTGNLILAHDGNLYGTTSDGGATFGTVYRISTSGAYGLIYIFAAQNSIANSATQQSAGVYPESGVIQGIDGNLYGTASGGGDYGTGAVFQLSLDGSTYNVIHSFAATANGAQAATLDAAYPFLGLVQDAQGNLYGTTTRGGSADTGAIYKISNTFQYAVIYNFPAPVSSFTFTQTLGYTLESAGNYSPNSALVIGPDGNFYGTASSCAFGSGAIYRVTPQGVLTILHQFGDGTVPGDGGEPKFVTGASVAFAAPPRVNAMVIGADGRLYGTTPTGGPANAGVVFQITTAGHYAIYTSFGPDPANGVQPVGVVQDADGDFYGATEAGGGNGSGTVFKIITALPAFTSPLQVATALNGPFTYHMTATNGPDTFLIGHTGSVITGSTNNPTTGLPAGFSFDGVNTLTATPAAAGTYTVLLGAQNSAGIELTPLTVTVMGTPVISSLLHAEGSTSGVPYQIQATESPTTFSATGLPPGVTVNDNNGDFVGTPTTPGIYPVTISATNAVGTGSAVLTLTVLGAAPTASQEYTQIRSFNDGSVSGEGSFPGAMTKGTDGSLYGVTAQGGIGGDGTVFRLQPSGVTRVVASFSGANGSVPQAVMQTADGTLYGTTRAGGSADLGVIFKITPDGMLSVIHSFGDGTVTDDGANPQAGLVLAGDGNFYGTTQFGGAHASGVIFQMTPAGVVTTIHSFGDGSVTTDGAQPVAALTPFPGLILTNGSSVSYQLMGTTLGGGAQGVGTIFAVSYTGQVHIFHNFGDPAMTNDGQLPHGPLTLATAGIGGPVANFGTFFGTTATGGSRGKGTVYAFSLASSSAMTILHSFGDGTVANDGENPISSLVAIPASTTASPGLTLSGASTLGGNSSPLLCGTTQNGGAYAGGPGTGGTVFTCAVSSNGTSVVTTILRNFGDPNVTNDGTTPLGGGVVLGPDNNVYGTTMTGGNSYGTAFAIQTNQSTFANTVSAAGWNYSGALPAGVGFDNLTGTLTGTPSSTAELGNYSITIYSSGFGGTPPAPQTITFQLTQTLAAWANLHAVSSLVTRGSTSGGGDGVPMLLKYLFDASNPGQPMTMADHAAMPVMMQDDTSVPNVTYLALTYRQNPGVTGLDVALEFSDDMVTWSTVKSPLKKQIGTDRATGDPIMEMGTPTDGTAHQFLRLTVTPH